MKKPKHSPTPWRTDVVSKDNIDIIAYPEDADTFRYVARECTDADAALIVRAVNSHEALKRALEVMVHSSERADEVGSPAQVAAVAQSRAALALSEKPE